MKKIYPEDYKKILKHKGILERGLNAKIFANTEEVSVEGPPEEEYFAEKVLDAVGLGFSPKIALMIKKQDLAFDVINIKKHMRGGNTARVRGRIVGKGGKALKTLSHLSGCYFEIKENKVGIIGEPENVELAQSALLMLIRGSKHANVYAFLEKHKPLPILDWGLKETKKKNS